MKISSSENESPPLSRLCGPVYGFCSEGKETTPDLEPTPVWAAFVGRLERQDFFEPVWVSQASEPKIPFINQPNLTSSTACPKELFLPENRGDTWGRK